MSSKATKGYTYVLSDGYTVWNKDFESAMKSMDHNMRVQQQNIGTIWMHHSDKPDTIVTNIAIDWKQIENQI